ncbi:TonB-dependent receptor [Thalassospira povalilytica]|uniref:TonB-dependent siderophore receptor n=1 Tax=Thalassospira povalilytica TaxID=732237 RepID=A0A8I1MAV4_9PROT|nr:TonB-dependent siderophore receptor [Thalassospira povalilytica]MBN8198346.1 TonB-dependent siderophore receptor [Thalassospira povalilytica]
MRFTGQKLSSTLLLGTALVLVCAAPHFALAQSADDATASEGETTKAVIIESEATVEAGDPTPPVYAGGQVATGTRLGAFGNKDTMDTPIAATGYTSELIKNQQARDISDVMDNDPSVINTNGFGTFANRFTIRGFDLTADDVSIDGLYGTAPRQSVALEMFDRVEVIKGASGFLNGMAPSSGGLGGNINLVPKRAGDNPVTSFTGSYGATSEVGGHFDFGRRFGSEDQFGVRTNVMHRVGEASIEDEDRETSLGSIALDYRGNDTRITFDAAINKLRVEEGRPTVAAGSLTSLPSAPSGSHNFAADGTYSDLEDKFAQLRFEYDATDSTMLYTAIGAHNSDEIGDYSSVTLTGTDGSGNFGSLATVYERDDVSGVAGIRQEFETGPVKHEINAGTTAMWQEARQNYNSGSNVAGNIYNSGPSTVAFGDAGDAKLNAHTILTSYFIADTLSFMDDKIHLTGGVRRQNVKSRGYDISTGAKNSNYDSSANSPMAGIVGNVTDQISVYANYIEGLAKGETVTNASATNRGETLAPFKTEQMEVGAKFDFGTFGGSIALFQAEKPSAFLNSSNVYTTDGEQRNRGLELTAFGEPVIGTRILGGITFVDAELTKTQNGTNDGNTAPGVPEYQATLGAEYDLPFLNGATVGGRLIHTASQYVNTGNTVEIPSWTRFDMSARYVTELYDYPVTFRANIENLTDNDYWETASTQWSYMTVGKPLTATFSLTADF